MCPGGMSRLMSRGPTRWPRLPYLCTSLRVLEVAGLFSRALMSCVLRARVVPEVVRLDQGAEMTSTLN